MKVAVTNLSSTEGFLEEPDISLGFVAFWRAALREFSQFVLIYHQVKERNKEKVELIKNGRHE